MLTTVVMDGRELVSFSFYDRLCLKYLRCFYIYSPWWDLLFDVVFYYVVLRHVMLSYVLPIVYRVTGHCLRACFVMLCYVMLCYVIDFTVILC